MMERSTVPQISSIHYVQCNLTAPSSSSCTSSKECWRKDSQLSWYKWQLMSTMRPPSMASWRVHHHASLPARPVSTHLHQCYGYANSPWVPMPPSWHAVMQSISHPKDSSLISRSTNSISLHPCVVHPLSAQHLKWFLRFSSGQAQFPQTSTSHDCGSTSTVWSNKVRPQEGRVQYPARWRARWRHESLARAIPYPGPKDFYRIPNSTSFFESTIQQMIWFHDSIMQIKPLSSKAHNYYSNLFSFRDSAFWSNFEFFESRQLHHGHPTLTFRATWNGPTNTGNLTSHLLRQLPNSHPLWFISP